MQFNRKRSKNNNTNCNHDKDDRWQNHAQLQGIDTSCNHDKADSQQNLLVKISIGCILAIFCLNKIGDLFNQPKQQVIATVKTSPVVQKNVAIDVNTSGTIQPTAIVSIKSQTDGIILANNFYPGQLIHKGQLLFEIDSAVQTANYHQALANLEKTKANLINAELELQKYNKLYKDQFISDEKYQQMVANYKVMQAAFAESIAAVEVATIKLDYTKIYAPIDGIAGEIFLDPGNLVPAGAKVLVNIAQIDPVNVLFNLSEEYLTELIKYINNLDLCEVSIISDNESGQAKEISGKLIFIDNKVDHLNGTIALKASFPNEKLMFWPGKFVNVRLTVKNLINGLVVPNQAIQVGQQGTYVYVAQKIKRNKHCAKIKKTLVTIGAILADETVIISGLQAGQNVITDGHGSLVDQGIVKIYEH